MSRPLRIVHTADSHIGAEFPVRPRHDRPRRGDDFVAGLVRVADRAAQLEADLLIHAGDLYNRSKPSCRAIVAAGEPLLDLAMRGTAVVIVPGNHERSAIPSSLLLSHPNVHMVQSPSTVSFQFRGARVAVSAVPCLRDQAASRFREAVEATGWRTAPADIRILAAHQAFHGAVCGPSNYRFRTGDDVVPLDAIPEGFDYVLAGHVHRHQVLTADGGPPIVYSGSVDRITFAEIGEPKGCVVLEETDGRLTHRFVEHPVRPMSVWPVDVTGQTRAQILERIEEILRSLPARAIAQARLTGSSSPAQFRGLRFAAFAYGRRPDVLFSVSTQAVELNRSPRCPNPSRHRSAFDCVDAPREPRVSLPISEVGHLPSGCGVYALYDVAGRLLYVGKSKDVRSRVRTHIRGNAVGSFFRGWTDQVASVEVRAAYSELEALLIEAELIRRLQPPYNRHMRRWTKYCYLRWNRGDKIEICWRAGQGDTCYGPYRSPRFAAAVRDVVAALDAVGDSGTTAGLHRILQGASDDLVSDLEAGRIKYRASSAHAATLTSVYEHAKSLKEAEALVGCTVIAPGPGDTSRALVLSSDRIRIRTVECKPNEAPSIVESCPAEDPDPIEANNQRLSRALVDSFCLAAQHVGRPGAPYRLCVAAGAWRHLTFHLG